MGGVVLLDLRAFPSFALPCHVVCKSERVQLGGAWTFHSGVFSPEWRLGYSGICPSSAYATLCVKANVCVWLTMDLPSRSRISGVVYELQGDMLLSVALCVKANVCRRAVDIALYSGVASPESHLGAGVVFAQPWCALHLCSKRNHFSTVFLQVRPVVDMGNGVRRLRFHSDGTPKIWWTPCL